MADNLPGGGFFGWFGRQVGYVTKAIKTTPAPRALPKPSAAQSGGRGRATQPSAQPQSNGAQAPEVLYRQGQVQEAEHPSKPGVKLRRTIIDEVIVDRDEPGKTR